MAQRSFRVHHRAGGPPQRGPQPVFFYDLSSPECYLAAERVVDVLGVVPEWEPVLLDRIPGARGTAAFRCEAERDAYFEDVGRRAAAQGLQPLRRPRDWPTDAELATSVATYAKQVGRGVAFSLAAFRQAFAAGRDLADPGTVLIAAAACEMHPSAVLRAPEMKTVSRAVEAAAARAAAAGVVELPAIAIGDRVWQGPDAPEHTVAGLVAEQERA